MLIGESKSAANVRKFKSTLVEFKFDSPWYKCIYDIKIKINILYYLIIHEFNKDINRNTQEQYKISKFFTID